jgi:predicted PurR-regulated permease PerM
MAATPGTVEHRVVHISVQAAVTVIGAVLAFIVGRRMFVAAHRPLSWAAAAAVVALLIDPLVDRLAVRIHRVPAVLLTFLAIGTIVVGTTYLVFDSVQHAVDRLEQAAPSAARQIEHREDRVGRIARDFDLTHRVESFTRSLDERVGSGQDVLKDTAGTAPAYLVCAILTVFFMTYGPRLLDGLLRQDPDEDRRERVRTLVGPAVAKARAAVLLTAGLGFGVGIAAAVVARALDLPAPAAVGLTAGVLALLPHVGIVVGSVPLLLLTLGFRSTSWTLVLLGAVLAAQAADSLWLRRRIADRSLDTGLLVPWVVAMVGYEVYGIGGAAYGLIFAIGGLAVFDRLHELNEARRTTAPSRRRAPAEKAAKRTKAPAKKAAPKAAG